MHKRILASLIVTSAVIGPAASAMAQSAAPVGAVNVRSGPGTGYSVIASLNEGQRAAVLAHEGTWLKVKLASGATGYMADWVTREVFDDQAVYVRVDTDVLNLRSGPDAGSAVLGQATQDQRFRLLEGLGDWYKLDAGALGQVWAAKSYLERVAQPPASRPPVPLPPPATQQTLPAPAPDSATPAPQSVTLAKDVTARRATGMYSGRDPAYDLVARVGAGEKLTYVSAAEGWVEVTNAAGQQGWVPGPDLYLSDREVAFTAQASYYPKENDWLVAFLRVREVVAGGGGLRLRSGPGADSATMRTLNAGDRMKLEAVPGGEFVQVSVAGGLTGWVSRNWLKPVSAGQAGESVRLYTAGEGILRLEVNGLNGPASVSAQSGTLRVALPPNATRQASLRVGEYEAGELAMSPTAATLTFTRPYTARVVAQTQDQTVVEIRPQVERIESVTGADRITYRLYETGAVAPQVRREGGSAVLTLPGAQLTPGAVLPAGISIDQTDAGLTARVQTDRPYAVKTGDGYVDLVVYTRPGLAGKTVVIDPGHGGVESGAVGPTGLLEKESNLGVALKLKPLLEAAGAKVVMTRTADTRCASPDELAAVPLVDRLHYDLGCRSTTANQIGADAFLSIHSNANPSHTQRGTETYWSEENRNKDRSWDLAALVQQETVRALGLQDRGVKEEAYYVIKYAEAPASLVELAFVDTPAEESLLRQDAFRQKAAEGLFRALSRFFQ